MAEQPADGRTARRDRNRDAVLDAVLELFAEDALEPSAVQVAERSGVSLRSVYRYFEDMDGLVRAAIERNLERVAPLFRVEHPGLGPVGERAARLVDARIALYEQVGPLMRATLRHADANPLLADRVAFARASLRAQIEQMFAPELARRSARDRRDLLEVLDMLLGFESLDQLRRVRGLSAAVTTRVLVGATCAQLHDGD